MVLSFNISEHAPVCYPWISCQGVFTALSQAASGLIEHLLHLSTVLTKSHLLRRFHPFPMPQELPGRQASCWPAVNVCSHLLTCVAAVPKAAHWGPPHSSGAHENKQRGYYYFSVMAKRGLWNSDLCKNVLLTTGLRGGAWTSVQPQCFASSLGKMREWPFFCRDRSTSFLFGISWRQWVVSFATSVWWHLNQMSLLYVLPLLMVVGLKTVCRPMCTCSWFLVIVLFGAC